MIHQHELILRLKLAAISADECFLGTWSNWLYGLSYLLRKRIVRQTYILVRLIVRDSEWLLLPIKIRHNIDKLHMGSPKSWSHIILWGLAIGWLWHLRWGDSRLRLLGGLRRLRFRGFHFALFNLDRLIIQSLLALNASKDIIRILILTLVNRQESCVSQFEF